MSFKTSVSLPNIMDDSGKKIATPSITLEVKNAKGEKLRDQIVPIMSVDYEVACGKTMAETVTLYGETYVMECFQYGLGLQGKSWIREQLQTAFEKAIAEKKTPIEAANIAKKSIAEILAVPGGFRPDKVPKSVRRAQPANPEKIAKVLAGMTADGMSEAIKSLPASAKADLLKLLQGIK
jgi:hypothetical protein